MKTRTINAVICKQFDAWLASIEDEAVRAAVARDTVITGGCIASMLLREPVNDFDVYFRTLATAQAVAHYYVEQFKKAPPTTFKSGQTVDVSVVTADNRIKIKVQSAGIASAEGGSEYRYFEQREPDPTAAEPDEYVEEAMQIAKAADDDAGPKFRPVFLSSNAITLSHKVQIVLRFFGDPDELHQNYDFVHCTNYWTSSDRSVTLRPEALEALLTRELRYIGSKYPLCSIIRTRKFIQRQWTINAGQYLKMAMQVSALDLTNPAVLEEQLVGVDYAYFSEVIAKVREKDPDKVNAAYLTEIIDRMF